MAGPGTGLCLTPLYTLSSASTPYPPLPFPRVRDALPSYGHTLSLPCPEGKTGSPRHWPAQHCATCAYPGTPTEKDAGTRARKPRQLTINRSVSLGTARELCLSAVHCSGKCLSTGPPEIPGPMPPCCQLDITFPVLGKLVLTQR